MSPNKWIRSGCLAIVALLVLSGGSLAKNVVVDIMIDFNSPAAPTSDQLTQVFNSMNALTNVIQTKGLNATIFASSDTATYPALKLFVTNFGSKPNYELALHGKSNGEKLSTMTYSQQLDLLTAAQKNINSCHICGGVVVAVKGFMPQSLDQNNDTFKALESLGFLYDAGFKSGILYLPGHMNDTMPYPIAGYNLYAVPISSYNMSGKMISLSDKDAQDDSVTGPDWYNILKTSFDEAAINGNPIVVLINNTVSGSGDYLDAFSNFIGYADSNNADFVTTLDLVNMTESGHPVLKAANPSACPTCGQTNESGVKLKINATVTHSQNCTNCNAVTG